MSLPLSLPSSLTDGSLTRAGIAAALVTASAAAVAGSTGAYALSSFDASHAATTLTTSHAAVPVSVPAQRGAVTPVAASAPAAAPVVKHTSPSATKAAQAASAKAASAKAASAKAASATSAPAGLGSLGTRIVSTAAQYEGTPYVYGATGPSSFDCSGFTQYVFKKMGISLPRTAQQQYDAAQHISKSQAQPGDLVFMGSPDGIYHVAIYAGNNKIWTAPEPGESVKLGNMFGQTSFGRIR